MNKWLFAAAACLPALALATPVTTATTPSQIASAKRSNADAKLADKQADKQADKPADKPVKGSTDANGGGAKGTALATDVSLGGSSASQLIYSGGVNPQQGANGNASGFAGAWSGSDWSSFAKFSGASAPNAEGALDGLLVTSGFSLDDTRHGAWNITNTSKTDQLVLDLVFAMHTGGGAGAWLFDAVTLDAGATVSGTWALNLLNNGGQLSDYSNLTLFARNAAASRMPFADTEVKPPMPPPAGLPDGAEPLPAVSLPPDSLPLDTGAAGPALEPAEVPEAGTLALFLMGLLTLGVAARRRKPAQVDLP